MNQFINYEVIKEETEDELLDENILMLFIRLIQQAQYIKQFAIGNVTKITPHL